MFGKTKKIHFTGIGGIGMSGMAEVLLNFGFSVSGSDLNATEITKKLVKLGARIEIEHNPDLVKGADVLVYSSAVKSDNLEVQRAQELRIPVIRRAEMLGEISRLKENCIAIAGTHGKTTTTSMVGEIFTKAALDPLVIVGGVVKNIGSNSRLGAGNTIVVEADEFDRSFLTLTPTLAVITTLESEHLDIYSDLEDLKNTFTKFANQVPFYGAVVVCHDEETLMDIIPHLIRRVITYGYSTQANVRAENVKFSDGGAAFDVSFNGAQLGEFHLHLPGDHNVKNALASIAIGLEYGVKLDDIKNGISSFSGVHRRFEIVNETDGILFVDDYAHHPTEVKATLSAAKNGWNRRVIAVFQPHLYSRTQQFYKEFGRSFMDADMLVVTEIYPAREEPIDGITGEIVADAAKEFGHQNVHYFSDNKGIVDFLNSKLQNHDMVITLGAGDIWKIHEQWKR
ncbi:UDP-N-acetylmuramate--L-alanine ligase [bacterium]|nr:UDP-N-acetylmuramate--L-alanine ligase [bacterium]